ncbi:DUF3231 family protein [Virgibacillus sp. NKC19-16]|uniref:DUF3231 family protein n=1 Tax=Virgibacillus salidurans TaxID=2831673 RepID=UPI001F23742A|nr:DUF3231 family protein [Virgibacillus sp. NKC19-16]UJL46173.1 DUF3231 family protein [Virgibacillus sp. NKC19-16]
MNEQKTNLTSSEIASLWTGYMNDTMSKYVLGYMLQHIEDPDIKAVVQYSYDMSSNHIEQIISIFENEQFAIPYGFTEKDVNMNAPWLFSDILCLTYVNHMAKVGMLTYSSFVSMSYREDVCNYFSQGLNDSNNLYKQSLETALSKGISPRHPYIEVPKETDYVDSKKYLSGLNPFSDKRPLSAVEITHLYQNVLTNSIGMKLCIAFAQTSPSKDVQDYMLRARDISKKHIKIFTDTLLKDDMETPQIVDVTISDSITKTFSDKLIMFHTNLMIAAGVGNYSTAASASQRSDLMVNYERLSLEVSKLAKSGADIMIKHEWLEQPPGIKDRKKLAKNKQQD